MIHIVPPSLSYDASYLLIRVIVGISFIAASRNKARNIKKFAKKNGVPLPVAIIITAAELVGGLGMALGILSQFAALGLMLLMLGTIRLHLFKWKSPYWASSGGWEYDLMLFALASVIAIHGAGRFSVMS